MIFEFQCKSGNGPVQISQKTERIKSKQMRLAGYVAHMGEMRNAYRILAENLKS
jgi:hypothetical protein